VYAGGEARVAEVAQAEVVAEVAQAEVVAGEAAEGVVRATSGSCSGRWAPGVVVLEAVVAEAGGPALGASCSSG